MRCVSQGYTIGLGEQMIEGGREEIKRREIFEYKRQLVHLHQIIRLCKIISLH